MSTHAAAEEDAAAVVDVREAEATVAAARAREAEAMAAVHGQEAVTVLRLVLPRILQSIGAPR
jgi:hypothetical protein